MNDGCKLTDNQAAILKQLAQHHRGTGKLVTSVIANRLRSLVNKGFVATTPGSGGVCVVMITDAGRAAIAPPAPGDAA